jgi:hypothetical protein
VDGRIDDVRASCGLCNPAMYVAADLVCDGARGRTADEVLALDVLAPASLDACFAALAAAGGGGGRPDDAREKLQYALLALQQALRVARGEPVPRPPAVPPPRDTDEDGG